LKSSEEKGSGAFDRERPPTMRSEFHKLLDLEEETLAGDAHLKN